MKTTAFHAARDRREIECQQLDGFYCCAGHVTAILNSQADVASQEFTNSFNLFSHQPLDEEVKQFRECFDLAFALLPNVCCLPHVLFTRPSSFAIELSNRSAERRAFSALLARASVFSSSPFTEVNFSNADRSFRSPSSCVEFALLNSRCAFTSCFSRASIRSFQNATFFSSVGICSSKCNMALSSQTLVWTLRPEDDSFDELRRWAPCSKVPCSDISREARQVLPKDSRAWL